MLRMRLAVAQSPGELNGMAARLSWLESELSNVTADLIVLPELFACGYNIGDAIKDRAEPVDGPTFAAMAELAKASGIAIHYGFAERDGDAIYNAALCVSNTGELLTHQRKLAIPPGPERTYFEAGTGCQTFAFCGVKIATLICYDAEFPETARYVAGLGAQLLVVPTALGAQWRWVAERMIPTRAYENGIYLAYANSAGVENGLSYLGASVIAGPDGVEEARAGVESCTIEAEIDISRVQAAQARLPYLHDRTELRFE